MTRRPLVLLAGLCALLAGASLAAAAPPSETGWSPAQHPADGQALDLSDDSDIIAFGLADTGTGTDDLHFLTVGDGPVASNPTEGADPLNTEGIDEVAVSADGTGIVAGVESGADTNVFFFNRSTAEDGEVRWTYQTPNPVVDLDITPDGDHVAVATSDGDTGAVYLLETRGGDETVVVEDNRDEPVHAVAVDDAGTYVAAGGEVVRNASSQGVVLLYNEGSDDPIDSFTLEEDLPGAVRTVAVTPDAEGVVAGTAAGRLASFVRDGASLSSPSIVELGASQAADLRIRDDGGLVACGATDGVHLLDRAPDGDLSPRWTAETASAVASLDASANLTHLAAAVPGSSGGVVGYHESRSEPIWRVDGGTDLVAIDGEPSSLAAGQGSNLTGYVLEPGVEAGFLLPNGTLASEPSNVPVVREGETAQSTATLRNPGSVALTYNLSASISGDWNVSVAPGDVQVLPNETAEVTVSASPGAVPTGRHNVTLEATAPSRSGVGTNVSVPFDVEGEADLRMEVVGANATRPVSPGDTPTAVFTVENRGNKEADASVFVRVTPSGSPSWTFNAPNQVGPLGPGASTSFQVDVSVPDNAADGDRRTFNVSIEGGGDRVARDVEYVVNPFREVSLDVQPGTRFVNSTVPGFYNATVENSGSVDTDFQFIFSRTSTGTPGWTIIAQRQPFVVGSDESRTLPIRIVAPTNGVPGDRVLVEVQVAPRDLADQVEPSVQDNVTISAVFKDLPDPNEDDDPLGIDGVPGPGIGAVAAALAGGAVASRSRRCHDGDEGEPRTPRTSETHKGVQAGREGNPSIGPPCRWNTSAR